MAIQLQPTTYLQRSSSYFDPDQNWTILLWGKTKAVATDGTTFFSFGDSYNFTNPYIFIGSSVATLDIIIETFDGSTTQDSTAFAAAANTWYWIAVTYNSVTHIISFYVNGALIGTLTLNISTVTFVEFLDTIGDGNSNGFSVAYVGVFQVLLNTAQIAAQKTEFLPLVTSLAFNKLSAPTDVYDYSGNGRIFTVFGVSTYIDGPLPPPNLTPATATLVGARPYTLTLDVQDAPVESTGHHPFCAARYKNSVWFKLVAQSYEEVFALASTSNNYPTADYDPVISVWSGPDVASLTEYTISARKFCNFGVDGRYFEMPAIPGNTYYVQIVNNGLLDFLDGSLVIAIVAAPKLDANAGDLLITDDTTGFPGAILRASDGQFRQIRPFAAGEFGDFLLDGYLCVQSDDDDHGISFYDPGLNLITTVDFGVLANVLGVKAARSIDTFYVMVLETGTLKVRSFSKMGVAGTVWAALPANFNNARAFAVRYDGSILYYGERTGVNPVRAYNLLTSTALVDLHAGFAGERLFGAGDGFCHSDNTIFFGYNGTGIEKLRRYNPDGTINTTYDVFDATYITLNHFAPSDDGVSFWIWQFQNLVTPTRFRKIRMSDGAVLTTFTVPTASKTNEGTNITPNTGPWAISASCPLLVLPVAIMGSTGTIIVQKVTTFTNIATIFDIFSPNSASPGTLVLSPPNWSLGNGEFEVFTNLTPGIYSLEENVPAGWSPIYNVSNGGDITAISVAAGETVIVTIYNNKVGSGIYYLLKNKMHDTLYTALIPSPVTIDVKIP